MKVLYALSTVLANIGDYSVSVGKSQLCGYFGNSGKNRSDGLAAAAVYRISRRNMFLGDYKTVYRCLRCYVKKSIAALILINLF